MIIDKNKLNGNVSHRGVSTQTSSVYLSVSVIFIFWTGRLSDWLRITPESLPPQTTTKDLPRHSWILCNVVFMGDADTREKLRFHSAELQPLVSVSGAWGLWSLEKRRGQKTWPGFKNNKSGISSSAFKWRKMLTGKLLGKKPTRYVSASYTVEIQIYLSQIQVVLSCYKT